MFRQQASGWERDYCAEAYPRVYSVWWDSVRLPTAAFKTAAMAILPTLRTDRKMIPQAR